MTRLTVLEAATYLSLVGTGAVQTTAGIISDFSTTTVSWDATTQTFDDTIVGE